MPLPDGVPRVTVTTGPPLMTPGGTPLQGKLLFLGPGLVTVPALDLTLEGAEQMPLTGGVGTVDLVPSDLDTMNPSGWSYEVRSAFTNAPNWVRYIRLTSDMTTVKLADVLVPDPVTGAYTVLIDPATLGAAAHAAIGTTAGTVAAGDDSRFGKVGGITVSGTPTAGQVLTANSGTAATWQTPAGGGGGGGSIRIAQVRITDDNLDGLPSAPSWTVVRTSSGTALQCSIAASVNDRIRVFGSFMRNGSHFLDWALLDSAGAINLYAGSGTASPLTEGNPAMYPSLSFSYVTGGDLFTVGAGHIDGSGLVTVALAHQGTAAGIVYAHATYPWRLRIENIGPEPA